MVFPGAVKTFTLSGFDCSVFDATGAVTGGSPSVHLWRPLGVPFDVRAITAQGEIGRSATTNPLDEGIDPHQSIGWTLWSEGRTRLDGQRQASVPVTNALSAARTARKSRSGIINGDDGGGGGSRTIRRVDNTHVIDSRNCQ